MKREERQSLLQRCIKWREVNIKEIRSFFPVFTEDTPKYKEIERMISYLKKENK